MISLLNHWILKKKIKGSYAGILLVDMISGPQISDEFIRHTTQALQLIERVDPRRFYYIQRELRYIINEPPYVSSQTGVSTLGAHGVPIAKDFSPLWTSDTGWMHVFFWEEANMRKIAKRKTLFALLAAGMLVGSIGRVRADVALTAGMKISGNTTIKPAKYMLTDTGGGIVQITGSDCTIDFKGAKLVGPGGKGIGIHITDARNVTIKNADVSGCLWGVVIERSVGIVLLDCTASRNNDLPPGTTIDESGKEPEDQWGGGIVVRDSQKILARRCISQHQWDGIDIVRSTGCIVENGDYSYNGNWGIHLWNSSKNTFRNNRAIWCTTGSGTLFQALTGWQTYDAQAVGIDHNSNENLIEGNDLRFGGDAIFIRANEGPITPGTVVPPRNGSHRNILRDNDCSFSPNNAIEVDLVDDTVIEGNNCSNSNYGMWLGYSRRCIVRRNICINDSAHAVEIENGQDDRFQNNVFGFDVPRPEGQLVYLRQNGRDKTPSAGYQFTGNVFYGAQTGVLLKETKATLTGNTFLTGTKRQRSEHKLKLAAIVAGDEKSTIIARTNQMVPSREAFDPHTVLVPDQLKQGGLIMLRSSEFKASLTPPVIELEGIPVWVRSGKAGSATFWMPADFWDRPAPDSIGIRFHDGMGWSAPVSTKIAYTDTSVPRIFSVTPNPAQIGDLVTVTGSNFVAGHVLLNNIPTKRISGGGGTITFQLPDGILTPTRYNLIWEQTIGEGGERNRTAQKRAEQKDAQPKRTAPIVFAVEVPVEKMPHLVSASFSPITLRVGELLKVTFTVRNNLPTPARLMTLPKYPFTYEEKQNWSDIGVQEVPGTLHLRVTSDHPGAHEPGSWPFLFGFEQGTIASGKTVTVVGYIKVETPGEHEFRVGLVATGARFIDDNAYRTKITVLP